MKHRLLKEAVYSTDEKSRPSLLDRLFVHAFKGFVYPQIWEDPALDLDALQLTDQSRVMTVASGGCNVLSYLVKKPQAVLAVDLNASHVALTRLKLAAIRHLPDYDAFFHFFGHADDRSNPRAYDAHIRPHLDPETRTYWDGKRLFRGRRIDLFSRNVYRYGLLGRFIGSMHLLARLHGKDPRQILLATTLEEQRELFEMTLAPLFDSKLVRFMSKVPVSLYGLGIPPAQYAAMASGAGGDMAGLLRGRLQRLACDFPLEDNYFAWQAFGRCYDRVNRQAVPPYLRQENYETVRGQIDTVQVKHTTMTDVLEQQAPASLDRYVLLDTQDWMNDGQMTELWAQITRTAKPGSRVIFRTAAEDSPLPGRVPSHILDHWQYDTDACREMTQRDRSSIYGGFHLYVRADD
ncbi:MAG: DUF3419 family protein [Magnetospiraceae bacterium]